MLVPIKWMSQYVDINTDEKTLADKLTLTGSHVDSIINNEREVENVITGKILEVVKHPNADKLVVTQIDINDGEPLQIITGAKNVKKGDVVPVALEGAKLPGGVRIKKTKFRGLPSYGMMCSYEELGFEDKVIPKEFRDGILILPEDTEIGKDVKEVVGLNGKTLDIEITFNRPDCLNIVGMARETAATLNTEFKFPNIEIKNETENIKDYLNGVEIENEELCSRFYAKVIKDVKIEPSPLWMQRALMDAGMRPINNIVDVTNYVMLELGQPLHAYDLEKLNGRKLIARRAKTGEKVITIDQNERELSESMLVIADEENPACIAGVMGGFNTEISESTKFMVLESANFNPKSVRETSKKIGLRSEASARNEKPMHYKMAEFASQRACQLIEMIGAGVVVGGYMEAGKSEYIPSIVTMRPYRAAELLGVEIPVEDMLKSLNSLEIKSTFDGEQISSEIPFFRADIVEEADLIEEVGRMYGFENIVSQPLQGKIKKGRKSLRREVEDEIKNIATGIGLYELTTYSFISPKSYNNICASEDSELRKYIRILNPLGEDYSSMRTTLMANMMDVIQRNSFRGVEGAKLFEVGNVFIPLQLPITEPPMEKSKLCIGLYGKYDFYDMKGVVEAILSRFGIPISLKPIKDNQTFHPGRTAGMYLNDECIGIYGEVSPEVLDNYGLNHSVYLAEIDIEKIVECKDTNWKYEPLPKYPAMTRDIAVKVKDEVLVGDMEETIKTINPYIIESVKLFDVYRGEHIENGYKSTAFSVTYRNKERTLKDKEVESIHKKILEALETKYGATLR
ncbi:phenylalanyl-tRNA synthetase beta chain [Sedimentibacter acidaminivorans]|jgi:phenylalanyl-tRNA synthetase beta chain|uniref:Phenylalanine--tRNA ligase beta subunit n=1 Tax=Sedimentibacter acidaminivorans TaxID=913099 RepID=A0ABS4G917_9FIRM|nr:phenylalanine--tRNA ligase subunit beta [Sedimentibacter acidaminivorans]MBP1924188.1 phenylalanyl-tRNA synthetase beta chain [Sedimentibacter acidaminivorans]